MTGSSGVRNATQRIVLDLLSEEGQWIPREFIRSRVAADLLGRVFVTNPHSGVMSRGVSEGLRNLEKEGWIRRESRRNDVAGVVVERVPTFTCDTCDVHIRGRAAARTHDTRCKGNTKFVGAPARSGAARGVVR